MTKLVLDNIDSLQNEASVIATINANSQATETALEKTLSRDGTAPNTMEAELDMNSNAIFNLPKAMTATQPVRKKEFDAALFSNVVFEGASTTEYGTLLEAQADVLDAGITGVHVNGYATRGDSGAAYWKKVSVEPTHNLKWSGVDEDGVTVWFEYGETQVNPIALGAKGDNVTNDSVVFQNIAAAVSAGFYQIVYFPAGFNFRLKTGRFDINGAPNGVVLYGPGRDLVTITTDTTTSEGRPFVIRNTNGVWIHGITWVAEDIINSHGPEIMNCSQVLFENNEIRDPTIYGLGIYEDGILIEYTDAGTGTHTAHYGPNFATTATVTFQNGSGYLQTKFGAAHGRQYTDEVYYTTTGTLPSTIEADKIYQISPSGDPTIFYISNGAKPCDDVIVRFNRFINCGGLGFEHFPKKRSNVAEIHDNYFEHCAHEYTNGTAADAATMKPGSGYAHTRVYNNTILDSGGGGIYIGLCDFKEVFNNYLHNCNATAIGFTQYDQLSYDGVEQPNNVMSFEFVYVHDNTIIYDADFDNYAGTFGIALNRNDIGPIVYANNYVKGGTYLNATFTVQTIAAGKNIYFVDNTIEDPPAIAIYMNAASGLAPIRPVIARNKIINRDLTRTLAGRFDIEDCVSPMILNNYWENVGEYVVSMVDNTGSPIFEGNTINGYNVTNTASRPVINVNDTATTTYRIRNNRVMTNQGFPKAWISCNSANPTFVMAGNLADDVGMLIDLGTVTMSDLPVHPLLSYGRQRHYFGTAAPTSGGPYYQGDIVWNTAPTAGGTVGWVCTATGTFGTWKAFGTIAS